MAFPKTDLIGQVFNRLTVVSFAGRDKWRKALWLCKCTCGSELTLAGNSLTSGNTTSCGCFKQENLNLWAKTHGATGTPEYIAWKQMRGRTLNQNNQNYDTYAERKPSEEFDNFEVFLADVGLRPTPKHSLDRINNDLGYVLGNLRWATKLEQANNTKTNRKFRELATGNVYSMAQTARNLSMNRSVLNDRINALGWSVLKATNGLYEETEC